MLGGENQCKIKSKIISFPGVRVEVKVFLLRRKSNEKMSIPLKEKKTEMEF